MKTTAIFAGVLFLAGALTVAYGDQDAKPDDKFATIKGKIKVTGDLPAPEKKLINKDPEVCGTGQREIHWYKKSGALLDETVVFLDGKFDGASWDGAEVHTVLVQEGCFFKPYLDIWKRGAEITITSKDAAAHNIHTYERIGVARRELFNFNQPNKDVRKVVIKTRRSQFVELTCDNHDFMAGWRFVAKNPYCTIAKDGTFTLKVPAGSHTLKVWHPMMGVLEEEIEVKAGEEKTVDFLFEYED